MDCLYSSKCTKTNNMNKSTIQKDFLCWKISMMMNYCSWWKLWSYWILWDYILMDSPIKCWKYQESRMNLIHLTYQTSYFNNTVCCRISVVSLADHEADWERLLHHTARPCESAMPHVSSPGKKWKCKSPSVILLNVNSFCSIIMSKKSEVKPFQVRDGLYLLLLS